MGAFSHSTLGFLGDMQRRDISLLNSADWPGLGESREGAAVHGAPQSLLGVGHETQGDLLRDAVSSRSCG
jgi:hypothetical protein